MKGLELEDVIEVIQPEEVNTPVVKPTTTVTKLGDNNTPQTIPQAAAQNFGKILELAGSLVKIREVDVVTKAALAKMEADRKQLLTEAEVYVDKKNADTKSVIDRMNIIRLMMQDFYQQSNQQITGEDFRQIITSIVDQMGRMNDE